MFKFSTFYEVNNKPVEYISQKYAWLGGQYFKQGLALEGILEKQFIKKFLDSLILTQEYEKSPRKEFIIIGRSNVGKSSLLNALFGRNIAEISNYPGKTRNLFFYNFGGNRILIDSPGYGFAKGNKQDIQHWGQMMEIYLTQSMYLKQAYVLIDAEHGIKDVDLMTMNLLNTLKKPFTIVCTKADKIKEQQELHLKDNLKEKLAEMQLGSPVIHMTSARRKTGIQELQSCIAYFCE